MFTMLVYLFGCLTGWFLSQYGTRLWGIKNALQHKLGKTLEEIESDMKK